MPEPCRYLRDGDAHAEHVGRDAVPQVVKTNVRQTVLRQYPLEVVRQADRHDRLAQIVHHDIAALCPSPTHLISLELVEAVCLLQYFFASLVDFLI